MRGIVSILLVLVPALASEGASAIPNRASRQIAVTFDDLPYAYAPGQPDAIETAERGTAGVLRRISAGRVPVAAFVNEGKLGRDADPDRERRVAILRRWIGAGAVLGNHTYSHADLNSMIASRFEEEIVRGERVIRRLAPDRSSPRFFRFPFNHTGDTPEKKAAVEKFLAVRGYTIAPDTIDSEDYVFNAPYTRPDVVPDGATRSRLRGAYADFVVAAAEFAARASRELFGREIPQILLLHANDINADALGEVLGRLRGRRFRFVSLEAAMRDPVYRTKDDFVTKDGPTWLWRWRQDIGSSVDFNGDPEPPAWVMKLFHEATR